jgi:hypothetical protein
MKTLSDFFGKNLRALEEQMPKITQEATQTAQAAAQATEEALKAEGKTEDEIKAALAESVQTAINAKLTELTKYEGDKLIWFKNALSLIQGKRGNLKRVVVMEAAEGEKSTQDARLVDGKYFAVEFYEEPSRAAPPQDSRGGKFGDKRGGGKGRGGDRGGRGSGGGGGGRDARPARAPSATGDAPRENRAPRRTPIAAAAPGTGKTSPLIILSGKSPSAAPVPTAAPSLTEKTEA